MTSKLADEIMRRYAGMSRERASHEGLRLVEEAWRSGYWIDLPERLIALRKIVKPERKLACVVTDPANGFIQFTPGHELKEGDRVRLVEMIIKDECLEGWFAKPVRGDQTFFLKPDVIESYKPAPEPPGIGDVVRHKDWPKGYTAEIAGIKGDKAAFWKWLRPSGHGEDSMTPNPRPLNELTKA